MKNTSKIAALSLALFAASDVSAQGKKHYGNHDNGYGKNHGSYQGRGKKVGHYKTKKHGCDDDRSVVYGNGTRRPNPRRDDRTVIYRDDRGVRTSDRGRLPVPSQPQSTPGRTVWDVIGGRQ